MRPDILQHLLLRFRVGMDSVRLHERRVGGNAVEKKRRQTHLLFGRDFPVNTPEPFGIVIAIIGRKPIPTSSTRACRALAFVTIAVMLCFIWSSVSPRRPSLPPSSMMTIAGWCAARSLGKRAGTVRRGVATDAGVDDLVIVLLPIKALAQQRHPAGAHVHAISGIRLSPTTSKVRAAAGNGASQSNNTTVRKSRSQLPEYPNGNIVSAAKLSKRVDTAEGALDILSGAGSRDQGR